MKRILVACGNGIATSTVVATKMRQFLEENGQQVTITQCKLMEVPSKVADYDLLVTTGQFGGDAHVVKLINALPLLTGIGADAVLNEILEAVKE